MISCLCITNKRPEMLERAIKCFQSQTFVDKELVILYQGEKSENFTPQREADLFHGEGKRIKTIPMEDGQTLGALRNAAIRYSEGEFIAQWDDDDWYHPDRLAWQMSAIGGSQKPVCVLSSVFLYDQENGASFRTIDKPFAGSLVAKKDQLKPYPAMARSEDTRLLRELDNDIVKLPLAELYLHVFHGGNAMERSHFDKMCITSGKMSETVSHALSTRLA